jgi:hypothetical protein
VLPAQAVVCMVLALGRGGTPELRIVLLPSVSRLLPAVELARPRAAVLSAVQGSRSRGSSEVARGTRPGLASAHHRASLLLCHSRPPSLCFCLRATLFATHRRDRTNTYIVRGAIGNLRAQASVAGGREASRGWCYTQTNMTTHLE